MKSLLSRLRSGIDRLGVRLAIVLAIALLPLMIVSIVRSQSVVNEAVARSQAALVGETLRAVREEVVIIERAKAVAQALSKSVPYLLSESELCSKVMLAKLEDTAFSFAGFYDTAGHYPCSSAPAPFTVDMNPTLLAQIADPKPIVLVKEDAREPGASVISASFPVFSDDDTLIGFTSVTVPHRRLRQFIPDEAGATFLTLNASGNLLTAPGPLDEAEPLLPRLQAGENITDKDTSFRALGRDGTERLYALAPVVDGELYALSTWPLDAEITSGFYLKNPALFPALMLLASLAVAWFAASLFVTRHVVNLRTAIQGFAATRKISPTSQFQTAPSELRDVASSFAVMTDQIIRDEAQIEDNLRQKDILLREVHHRVKNNLQLIASIMSMQMRQSRSEEVKQIMQSLHDRVNSLATIHRNLYQTSGQADIRMDEHLDVIVKQVVRMAARRDRPIDLKTDFAEIRLNPDQAVPLSLFVTEALTNALKYIGAPEGENLVLQITLDVMEDDIGEVTIVNSVPPNASKPLAETSSGLGSELMEAFAMQLSGTFSAEPVGNQFRAYLTFPIEPLTAKS